MKAIKKDELIEMINVRHGDREVVFKDEIEKLFEDFGDNWFYSRSRQKFVKCD